jgi:hypothetical protein
MFEIGTIKVSPDKVALVNSGMAAHNKKYHASGPYGARVYNVVTGTDAGAYKWVMGPGTWSGLDARPSDELHDMDWDSKVEQYTLREETRSISNSIRNYRVFLMILLSANYLSDT